MALRDGELATDAGPSLAATLSGRGSTRHGVCYQFQRSLQGRYAKQLIC